MSITKVYHFDSINSNLNPFINSYGVSTSNSFNTNFKIQPMLINAKSVELVSLEMLILFGNIRINSTNVFSFIINSVTYNLSLSETNYTSISTLLLDLNLLILNTVLQATATIVLSVNSSNKIVITIKLLRPCTFIIIDTVFTNQILGLFSSNTLIDTATESTNVITTLRGITTSLIMTSILSSSSYFYMIGSYPYCLNLDNYIYLHIPQFGSINSLASFKIPFNIIQNSFLYMNESTLLHQIIPIKPLQIDNFDVKILDRFNKIIDPKGSNYSFSLKFTF